MRGLLMNTRLQVDKEGGVAMEDAAGFFANVFGGEQFMDYVSLPSIPQTIPSDDGPHPTCLSADRRDFADEGDDVRGDDDDDGGD